MKIVETAINNARLTLSVLVFLLVTGALAYNSIPKEAEPDIQIPIIYVSVHYEGISPEDSERLILRPLETALKSIQGIKKMTGTAYQGGGNVLMIGRVLYNEFNANVDWPVASAVAIALLLLLVLPMMLYQHIQGKETENA